MAGFRSRGAIAVAAGSLAVVVAAMLHLAGRPLSTNDFWWHLKMGEIYAEQGLDLARDPISFTADSAPDPHQWLFGVGLHAAQRRIGLHGLRVIHTLAVAGILWLAYSSFRRVAGSAAIACAATAIWLALAWWRLFQFRPDLLSIAATLAIYRLLIEAGFDPDADEPRAPPWRNVAIAVGVLVVWANAHTLFAIGPALLVAALSGAALSSGLRSVARDPGRAAGNGTLAPLVRKWGAALAIGLVATLMNPRGIDQHLTFFESARSSALWSVRDEWTPFDPLDPNGYGPAMSPVTFFAADAVLLGFAVVSLVCLWRFARVRDASALSRFGPIAFGLGLAGGVALATAVRFLWMGVFPLLYLVRFARRPTPVLAWCAALATLAVAVGFMRAPNYQAALLELPSDLASYLANPFDRDKYYMIGVEFLRETGLEGRMFNSYAMGGFAAYWLAPALQTFVDGRMNFPLDVLRDYKTVMLQRVSPTESYLDVLERRQVDVFFGVGLPTGTRRTEITLYTTANLERSPDWLLVSRSMRHAIYLRNAPRNRANLDRVADYYRAEGVPFDRERGLDVSVVIAQRPDWASSHNLLPSQYAALVTASESTEPTVRIAALEALGLSLALAGAYREQLDVDRIAAELRPRAVEPLRRIVYALLRLDQPDRAVAVAQRLLEIDPTDPRSQAFSKVANAYRDSTRSRSWERPGGLPRDAMINVLPLVPAQ